MSRQFVMWGEGTPARIPTFSFFPLFPVKLFIFLGVRAKSAVLIVDGFISLFAESSQHRGRGQERSLR